MDTAVVVVVMLDALHVQRRVSGVFDSGDRLRAFQLAKQGQREHESNAKTMHSEILGLQHAAGLSN